MFISVQSGIMWNKTFIHNPFMLEEKQMTPMNQDNTESKKSNIKIIALVLVSVILAASLVSVIAVYLPMQVEEKDKQIKLLTQEVEDLEFNLSRVPDITTYQNQINSYVSQIAYLNSQITSLNSDLSDFNDTVTAIYADYANLQNIVQLTKYGILYNSTLTQNANTATTVWNNQLDYAGYIVVQASSSSDTTYAQVRYAFGETLLDYNQTLGTSGTTIFPVLPSVVEVRLGNTMQSDTSNVTATAVYYY